MNNLHIAIIEDFEQCLVSRTQDELRKQVATFLTSNSIEPPTDEEWRVCVLAEEDRVIPLEHFSVGLITYYNSSSVLI